MTGAAALALPVAAQVAVPRSHAVEVVPSLPTAMHNLRKRDEKTWTVSVDCKAADM